MVTWAYALGLVTWAGRPPGRVTLSGADSLLSGVAKPNVAVPQTRMPGSRGSRPSHWGNPSPFLPATCPTLNLLEVRHKYQSLGSIPFGPQVTSNLGKMILKEEMEKSLPIRRKTRSLPDRTPFHACECHQGGSRAWPDPEARTEQLLSLSVRCLAPC